MAAKRQISRREFDWTRRIVYATSAGLFVRAIWRAWYVFTPHARPILVSRQQEIFDLLPFFGFAVASMCFAVFLSRCELRFPGECIQCGYDLRGSTTRCPECGEPMPKNSEDVADDKQL